MKPHALLAVAVVLSAAAAPLSSGQDKKPAQKPVNLLVNGSFEKGPDPGKYKPLDEDSTDIEGWIVTRGQIDYIGTHWQAADGQRSIDLHGSPGFGGIAQSFPTKKGQKYRVSFALAGSPTSGEKKVGVRAAGQKTSFTFDATNTSAENMGWVTKTWDFTARDDRTTLEIHTLETENSVAGPAIDDVSVIELKE